MAKELSPLIYSEEGLIVQERVSQIEEACGRLTIVSPETKPLFEAMAATGTDEQIEAFIAMQKAMRQAKDRARPVQRTQIHGDRVSKWQGCGSTDFVETYKLEEGLLLGAAFKELGGSDEGPNAYWETRESWSIEDLEWPGLDKTVAVYASLQYLRGQSRGDNFRSWVGEPVDKNRVYKNLHYVVQAVRRSNEGQPELGDNLVCELVERMGVDPAALARRYLTYLDHKSVFAEVRDALLAEVTSH